MSLDLSKAFDIVDHNFLLKAIGSSPLTIIPSVGWPPISRAGRSPVGITIPCPATETSDAESRRAPSSPPASSTFSSSPIQTQPLCLPLMRMTSPLRRPPPTLARQPKSLPLTPRTSLFGLVRGTSSYQYRSHPSPSSPLIPSNFAYTRWFPF